jgi:hypothetical protein
MATMNIALAFPTIDTERMTPTQPGDGEKMGARAWFAVVFVALFALWMVWRWLL